jgi:mutual gliding-motility protein MglA
MVFFNYATMQMAAKIVYYGPGLCGKTTNLHYIYQKAAPQTRGEMVSLETETDRTLFFDLLPIDVGVIGGFKARLQLYTVPGQVFYNTTRKLVLKGADGIVFVTDSQKPLLEANLASLGNLRENLAEIGLDLDETPLVFQLNKRDLPNALPPEDLQRALDPERRHEFVEASAVSGKGVFETLKVISRLTLKNLRARMMGDETAAPTAAQVVVRDAPIRVERPAPVSLLPEIGSFEPPKVAHHEPLPEPFPAAATPEPVAVEEPSSPAPPAPTGEPAPPAGPEPTVKTVKVRSSIDVMAELDSLRKKATQGTKRREKPVAAAPTTPTKTIVVSIGDDAAAVGRIRVVVQVESPDGTVLSASENVVDAAGERQHEINLKIDLGSGT